MEVEFESGGGEFVEFALCDVDGGGEIRVDHGVLADEGECSTFLGLFS